MDWKIYDSAAEVINALSAELEVLSKANKTAHISLSGGSTPKQWFAALSRSPYAQTIKWYNLHFWWGDERCVAPNDSESNFGQAYALLFRHVDIPSANIHRICGEADPENEVKRYAREMGTYIPSDGKGFSSFDWIILGMGNDGHTASLFPGQTDYEEQQPTIIARNPDSGQLRISKSAALIQAAQKISYLVLGSEKAKLIGQIHQQTANEQQDLPWPAAQIRSQNGITEWLLDKAAAKQIV